MISVQVDSRRVQRKLNALAKGLSAPQVRSALNAATKSARSESRRLALRVLNIRAFRLYQNSSKNSRGDLLLMDKATASRLRSRLVFSGKLIPAHFFSGGVRKRGKGVVFRPWRGLGPFFVYHGFIPRPGKAAFRRVHRSPSTREQRLPIEQLVGPSVADALDPARNQIEAFAASAFEKQYLRKLRGALGRG